ncbi:hypothetical protein SeMB42_g06663 [Synchytrium endobioticum]|uniref:Cilia- and flagella-associated protein 157 n=1 Tax=Synchytrium endobioticum TaxID=286115 RepID=A0A507CG06_9FUNG|nr:hypothetical protein SeMB42_g06663 [Synchytrium endobioticum]TPX49627.1 hypothetical protein SeLEV6574_g01346 [Synchytrium endobioticum]
MSEKKGKKGGGEENPIVEVPSELTGELLEAKVRDLNDKLQRYKNKCEVLTGEIEVLGKAQRKIIADKQDIVEFLNIKVVEHEKHIGTLEQRVRELQNEKKEAIEAAKLEAEEAAIAARTEIDQLQLLNHKYKTDLDSLLEFKSRKDELESMLKSTQTNLDTREREFKNSVHELERKVLQDKNVMKNEMLHKVNDAVSNFRRVADQQMAETTKRALRENMVITAQLKKMSSRTIDLIAENESLTTKVKQIKTSNALLAESEQELAKKNQANQKVIQLLVEKLKESDKMLELACDIQAAQNQVAEQKEDEQKTYEDFAGNIGEELLNIVNELFSLRNEGNEGGYHRTDVVGRLTRLRDILLDKGFGSLMYQSAEVLAETSEEALNAQAPEQIQDSQQPQQQKPLISDEVKRRASALQARKRPLKRQSTRFEVVDQASPVRYFSVVDSKISQGTQAPGLVNSDCISIMAVCAAADATGTASSTKGHTGDDETHRQPKGAGRGPTATMSRNELLLSELRPWGDNAKTQPKRKAMFARHS